MKPLVLLRYALFSTMIALLAGCGVSRRPISGTVTFDGKPIDAGGIIFVPLDSTLPQGKVTTQIVDGKYSFDETRGPFPGKYRVEIMWTKKTGKKKSNGDGGTIDATVEGLPPKYNETSELTREVESSTSTLDFTLTP